MVYTFEDTETIVVKADLLDLCLPGQFIETAKRPTGCENLFWWLCCYPNGCGDDDGGHVSVYIYTSIGGFEAERTFTIDRFDIESHDRSYYENPMQHGHPKLASHTAIRSGSIIQNGSFVIRCKVNFEINLDKLAINNVVAPVSENSCIVKFDRKTLETYKTGQRIIEQERTVDGITWLIDYFPCGEKDEDKGYVSVFFHFVGGPVKMELSCGMSVGGVFIQRTFSRVYGKYDNWGNPKWFSHKQIQLADHKDDVIDLVCKIRFDTPVRTALVAPMPLPIQREPVNKKTCHKDSVTFTIMECQLELNEVSDFDSTSKKFAEGSDKHQWRILYYPAGDTSRSKGHISLHIEASTTETKTVILSGVIKIDGSPFKKKFNMIVEEDSSLAFSKLVSHEELRRVGGIVDNQIRFICDASFETQDLL